MTVMPGVIIYNSEYEGIREFLTSEQKGELLDALMDFGCYGEFYKGNDRMIQMAFGMLSATVRREQDKYDATCKRNAEKARKRSFHPKGPGRIPARFCRKAPSGKGSKAERIDDRHSNNSIVLPLY